MADESPARITRVVLKNYKSIVSCDVELKALTILVGPNGSGKSNFVDALRFVSEALTVGLERAIRNRGNVGRILSKGHAPGDASFSIELYLRLESGVSGRYKIEIEGQSDGQHRILQERLTVPLVGLPSDQDLFLVDDRTFSTTWARPVASTATFDYDRAPREAAPNWVPDRLLLASYVGVSEGPKIRDLLASMAFHDPDPSPMRVLAPAESAQRLLSDGRNVASILRRIQASDPETMWRITTYLSRVLPGLERLEVEDLRGYDLLTFHQDSPTVGKQWDFTPDQMSDGTLRALAVLVALLQTRMGDKHRVSLVGIEEPEAGLHPAGTGALLNALIDASVTTQVLVTTHSSDLLDSDDVDVDSLVAVVAEDGVTQIGPVDKVGRSLLRDRLYTAGELLSIDQLRPATSASKEATETPAPDPVSG